MKDIKTLSATDYDNLVWDAFEKVADDASKARRRLEKLREGTASASGLNAYDTLRLYKETLEAALEAINAVIEE